MLHVFFSSAPLLCQLMFLLCIVEFSVRVTLPDVYLYFVWFRWMAFTNVHPGLGLMLISEILRLCLTFECNSGFRAIHTHKYTLICRPHKYILWKTRYQTEGSAKMWHVYLRWGGIRNLIFYNSSLSTFLSCMMMLVFKMYFVRLLNVFYSSNFV